MTIIMKRTGIILFLVTLTLMAAFTLGAANTEEKGAEEMNMAGGEKGEVWFPHQQHQQTLGDCQLCHDLFPQESGSIEKQKAEGSLKKKQVMNKKCIACHRKMKKSGQASGPVSCKKCHNQK